MSVRLDTEVSGLAAMLTTSNVEASASLAQAVAHVENRVAGESASLAQAVAHVDDLLKGESASLKGEIDTLRTDLTGTLSSHFSCMLHAFAHTHHA